MIFRLDNDYTVERVEVIKSKTYDAIVVGGGTSGLIAALTLIERGKTVCIIEAGPFSIFTHVTNTELRFQSDLNQSFRRSLQYNQVMPNGENFGPNISCVGGRGMFWNGAAPRFQNHDFNGWPITLKDLDSQYDWIEQQFRVNNVIGESELSNSIIEQIRDKLPKKVLPAPFAYNDSKLHSGMIPSGVSSGLAIFFRNTVDKDRKEAFDLLTKAFVKSIIISGNKAISVEALLNNESIILKGSKIIVAAGCIESCKLLATSKIPDPYSRIGVGVQEHLFYRSYWNGAKLYNPRKRDNAAVYIPATGQDTEQIEIHAPGNFLMATDFGSTWAPDSSDKYQIMIRSFAATQKKESNYLEFKNKSLGGTIVHFTYSDYEIALQQKMKDSVSRIAEILSIEKVTDGFANMGGSYHEAGGLDMGDDPTNSVTDTTGRVHTMENVYVVDASTFPALGATNPHLTIAALSRRQTENIF